MPPSGFAEGACMRRVVRLLSCVAGMSILFVVLASAASAHVTVSVVDATQGAYTVSTVKAPVLKLAPASSSSQSSAGGPVVTAEPKKQSQTVPVVLGVVALVVAVAAAVAAGLALVRSRRQTGERG